MRPDEKPPSRHVLVVGGIARSLVNFRGPLIRELLSRGHRVTAAAADRDTDAIKQLTDWGVKFESVRLRRAGMNPLADIGAFLSLTSLMRSVRPDIFLGYTMKPVIYGLLASRMANIRRRVAMIEGLGYAFTEGPEVARSVIRRIMSAAFRVSLPMADALVVLNRDDESFFQSHGFVSDARRVKRVSGTGVDLDHFRPEPFPDGPITFLMISRLIGDKGVREFIEAARIVNRSRPATRFALVGAFDRNPTSVRPNELKSWVRDGIVEYRGAVADVRPELAACHVFVLPSAYREGMPRTILEAMATGRPVITTDVPGCRETVVGGKNGILVPPRDVSALAGAMQRLADDRSLIAGAGAESLTLCRSIFDARMVASQTADFVIGDMTG